MPAWYYDKKDLRTTPSALDGIDYDCEMWYRKEGARFIIDTGSKMDLGYYTTATGVVYFHRFYMFHSFRQFPRYVTACCCLFLAGKVEETPKKCKDIIKVARTLLSDSKFAQFGDDPKEEVMTLERILLQTIKFDLQVDHPYNYLLKYAKCLKGDKSKLQKMVQMAWTFVNDSLCTTLALQWEPEIVAVALMYLAGKLSQFDVVDWVGRVNKHLRWWDMFVEDVTMDLLEDICHQVLDLYSQQLPAGVTDSEPLLPRTSHPTTATHQLILTMKANGNVAEREKIDVVEQPPPPLVPPATIPTVTELPPYVYPTAFPATNTHANAYPPAYSTPIPTVTAAHIGPPPQAPPPPHIAGPSPVLTYSPYMAPPHFPSVVQSAPFFQPNAPPPSRQYYPPS